MGRGHIFCLPDVHGAPEHLATSLEELGEIDIAFIELPMNVEDARVRLDIVAMELVRFGRLDLGQLKADIDGAGEEASRELRTQGAKPVSLYQVLPLARSSAAGADPTSFVAVYRNVK